MKTKSSCFLILLMLTSPLYPAILTIDLRMIIPTGDPVVQDGYLLPQKSGKTILEVSLCRMRTPTETVFIEENANPWLRHFNQIIENESQDNKSIIPDLFQEHDSQQKIFNYNVILE